MKLNKLTILAMALVTLAGSGCSSDDYDYGKGDAYGTLSFSLNANNQLNTSIISRAGTMTITEALGTSFDAASFIASNGGAFEITLTDSNEVEKYNGVLSGWKAETALSFGEYMVCAEYTANGIGFYGAGGLPEFESEDVSFTIAEAKEYAVAIPVALANSILRVRYTDMFKNYFSDCTTNVTATGSTSTVTYNYNETRGAFFPATKATIKYTLTPSQAQGANATIIEKTIEQTLAAKTCHTLTYDVTNVGGVNKLTISLDDTNIVDVNIDDIDLNE